MIGYALIAAMSAAGPAGFTWEIQVRNTLTNEVKPYKTQYDHLNTVLPVKIGDLRCRFFMPGPGTFPVSNGGA